MSNDFLRLDTNIAKQLDVFQQYGTDGDLCRNLLFYLAFKEQHAMFKDVGTIDAKEIAEALGISRNRLLEKHHTPKHIAILQAQFRNSPALLSEELSKDTGFDMKHKIFDNVLENALFLLNTQALRFLNGYRHYVENGLEMTVQEEETFQFLRGLKVRQIKAKNGKLQYVYDYVLSPEFMRNFSLYFNAVNFNHIIALKPKNLDALYICLATTRNILRAEEKHTTNDISFNRLCRLAKINYQLNPNAQTKAEETQHIRDRKKALNKKFAELEEITKLGVSLSWITTGLQIHPYTPLISFDPEIPNLIDPKEERAQMLFQTFCKLLVQELNTIFPNALITEDNAKTKLFNYFTSKNFSPDLIKKIYIEAYMFNFKKLPNFNKQGFKHWFIDELPAKLQQCKDLLDMKRELANYKNETMPKGI